MMPGPPPARGGRGVACVQLWIHAGAAAERSREHGCAHLFEHMVFKPWVDAEGRSHDLASAIEALGGDVNAFTSHDETVFHATLPGDAIEEALAILLPAVTSRPIDPALLDREKQVVIEEIHQYEDDPAARSIQALMADLYGDHPYARPVLGELEELQALTTARLRGWQRRQCRGESLTLVVTGCADPGAVEAQARALL
ncbi:possible Zn-dependent peptidase, partial [Plesiocystis pacifica SIR-1]